MLPFNEPSHTGVSLTQMLNRREQRVADQQALLARFVFDQSLAALLQALWLAGHVVLAQQGSYGVTGPEMLMLYKSD